MPLRNVFVFSTNNCEQLLTENQWAKCRLIIDTYDQYLISIICFDSLWTLQMRWAQVLIGKTLNGIWDMRRISNRVKFSDRGPSGAYGLVRDRDHR